MAYTNLGGTDTQAAGFAQLTAITGPLIPYFVWLNRRDEEPTSARDAATAVNFGAFVLVVFLAGTSVRLFAPVFGWVGAAVQLGVAVMAVVLALQAYFSIQRGMPARYPVSLNLLKG